jgi:tetraacyldisaccharide 4'-kinase
MPIAPSFWYDPEAPAPWWARHFFEPLYRRIVLWRLRRPTRYRPPCPVVCVGNLTVGGTGKTPLVRYLSDLLSHHGASPAVLLRGYGGRAVLRHVMADDHPALVGDEALIHALYTPTVVAKNRAQGAKMLATSDTIAADIIIMDDGLQNTMIAKDLSLIVVDGPRGFGNGHLLPAGPLREPIMSGLSRAQAIVLIGEDGHSLRDNPALNLPIFQASLRPRPLPATLTTAERVIAFAGIGRPEKFFDTVRETGLTLVQEHRFGDHQPMTAPVWQNLVDQATAASAKLVTTRKDWLRLPLAWRDHVAVIDVDLVFDDKAVFDQWFLHSLAQAAQNIPKTVDSGGCGGQCHGCACGTPSPHSNDAQQEGTL